MAKFNPKNATFIDLFAGIGGFRYALESHGAKCVYTSEWDKFSQITYKENFGDLPDGDITKVKEKNIPKHNIICAGFPCQAFSISGKQKGFNDARGTLFFDIIRIAKLHKPEILFLENVKNLAKHDNGKTLKVIEETLEKLGYDVNYKVLNASYFGSPTSRKRIYFVCFRKDLNVKNFSFPAYTYEKVRLKDFLQEAKETEQYVINRDDIRIHEKNIDDDLFGNPPFKPVRIGTMNKGGQGERIYSDLGHAVTFSAYGGGPGKITGAYLINGKVRRLSPRECAQVMGFPKDFKIPVRDNQALRQFGNSVVVPVLKNIFAQIIKTFDEK
ncbi:MAG: DNA (cytosine-5-)-methyltransferase [Parcubacteria group bacterium]|nr:DNA (cytosine-5-)-methyltransferase [Parcubacteria group bacterium]